MLDQIGALTLLARHLGMLNDKVTVDSRPPVVHQRRTDDATLV